MPRKADTAINDILMVTLNPSLHEAPQFPASQTNSLLEPALLIQFEYNICPCRQLGENVAGKPLVVADEPGDVPIDRKSVV